MAEERIATLIRKVEDVAAITPDTRAIIVALDHEDYDAFADALRDSMEIEELGLPWVIIVPGKVGLAGSTLSGPGVGIFVGANELSLILELPAPEVKEKLVVFLERCA